ncbi:MAG: hypothetical protein QOE27_2530 [Solirubrobacteraceae bacterium]|nr:hypothetical protein [Solirubrobacteraceae bacterium]
MPPPRRSSLRTSAVFVAGALSLHELRFLVSWGRQADGGLTGPGHAYLVYAMPIAVALVAAGLGQVLVRIGGVRSARPSSAAWAAGVRGWLVGSAVLLGVYAGQETVEGLLAPGHAGGLAGVFGHGGLVAVPLALAIGGLIAVTEREAATAVAAPSRLRPTAGARVWAHPAAPLLRGPSNARTPAGPGDPLALHLSGRAPPGRLG